MSTAKVRPKPTRGHRIAVLSLLAVGAGLLGLGGGIMMLPSEACLAVDRIDAVTTLKPGEYRAVNITVRNTGWRICEVSGIQSA